MRRATNHLSILAVFVAPLVAALGAQTACAQGSPSPTVAIDYNRDVRPILSNHCYACHGPDQAKRQAGLRLDKQELALAALESDGHAIVPGHSDQSKLIARVVSTDDAEVMPPPEAGRRLKETEIETLRKWIDQGAVWKGH